jgi:site-specific recombinase XerD
MKEQQENKQKLFIALKKKGLAESTTRGYLQAFNNFCNCFNTTDIQTLPEHAIINYIQSITRRKLYFDTLSVLRFFYKNIFNKEYEFRNIKKYGFQDKGTILKSEDIQAMLHATKNPKHRLAIVLIYSCMLQVNELLSIRIEDIDYQNKIINIKDIENSEIRKVPFDTSLIPLISLYYDAYSPSSYLIEGRPNEKGSKKAIYNIIESASIKARIPHKVSAQLIRRSGILQLIEHGVDISIVKQILGHKEIKVTSQYKKISKPKMDLIYNPIRDIHVF